jgi:tungstate transport system substrate-binding protein
MNRPARITPALVAVAAIVVTGCGGAAGPATGGTGSRNAGSGTLILATTTSTQDSGLLDDLLPLYEHRGDCRVKTVAVGSGEALALGASGDADVLLVHSQAAEEQYMAAGDGRSRTAVMHNDFVLLGPKDDPAETLQAKDALDALTAIAAAKASFASRGDDSGTNAKELALWQQAGITPAGRWYFETGQGMGETLTIADQKQAYTLSDRATFLATKGLALHIVSEGATELLNPYHVIVVKHAGTNLGCAKEFASWLVTAATQKAIGEFGVTKYGQPLFFPDAKP